MGTVTLSELSKKNKPQKEAVERVESKKRKSLKSFEKSYKNINPIKKKISEVDNLKEELTKLKEENHFLKSGKPLTKNEEKVLNAIKSEIITQDTTSPIISTSMLRKKYKVSAKYQGQSVSSLILKSLIEREEATFSGKVKTFRWKLLRH